jgi:hypothetical protein
MEADVELDAWRRHWQAESPVLHALKERVEQETRAMRRYVVGESLVTIVFGGGSLAWAALSLRADVLVLALGVWAFIAIAWTISFLLRRGAWMPLSATTTAFMELSILRCRRKREAVVAQAVLYVMILGFDLAWIYFARARDARSATAFLTSGEVAWVWGLTLALGFAAVKQRQKLARELEALTNLREQIEDGSVRSTG